MRKRPSVWMLAAAVVGSVLTPITAAVQATPAAAHTVTTCTVRSDSATSDYYPPAVGGPWSDNKRVRFRILWPTGTGCIAKPTGGWPLIVHLHGANQNRCASLPFATRATIASWGYAVLSFNARGGPSSALIGNNPSPTTGCDQLGDAIDALDDGGRDLGGARDKLDISELITAINTYASCSPAPCVDTSKVGITGFSYGGFRTWMMGVPASANPQYDSRVKAIAPFAAHSLWTNLKELASDGASTPIARPRAHSESGFYWTNNGWMTTTAESVGAAALDLERARNLNLAVPPSAETFWNSRYIVDDDPAIDKASLITMPTFVMLGWLDNSSGIFNQQQIEAYRKLNPSNPARYLYAGTCGHTAPAPDLGDPCGTTNKAKMSDALHRFFDRHVRGDTTCGSACEVRPPGTPDATCLATGPCAMRMIPKPWVSSNNNPMQGTNSDAWPEVPSAQWPPSGTTEQRYFRNDGTLQASWETTSEETTSCAGTPPIRGTGCSTYNNNIGLPLIYASCLKSTYANDEVQSFRWPFTAEKKIVKIEADLWVKSTSTRQQVVVDLELWQTGGTPTFLSRVWRGGAQVIPTKRDGTIGQAYRFKFQPGGSAWTVSPGQELRFKVASKLSGGYGAEPVPAVNTLMHSDVYRSSITLSYV